jgi:glycosyltransferase involved in cell wall biosynthesis
MRTERLVNVSDLLPKGAAFVDFPPGIQRVDVSGIPQNLIERRVRRPALARYRAAWEAVGKGEAVLSHMPRMTAAVADAMRLRRRPQPHLAFSFNFTDLPTGADLARFRRSLKCVDRFLVYSTFEQGLYPQLFSLPRERFVQCDWTQDIPDVDEASGPYTPGSYIVAIGGEGRDYETLVAAAARLPKLNFVIIARPRNDVGPIPENVSLLTNVPAPKTWRIGVDSAFMVLPLKSRETCCGQITLVSGRQLGIPILATESAAISDYVDGSTLVAPGDVAQLADALEHMWVDRAAKKDQAVKTMAADRARFDRNRWKAVIADFVSTFV